MKQLDADQPGLADTAKDDPVDSISCLLYGALGLDERQFGEVFSLVQRYHHQAKQFKTDGDTSAAENPGFKQLMEAGKTELVSILKPEQARIFEAIAPQLQFTPDNFNFNFDIPDK